MTCADALFHTSLKYPIGIQTFSKIRKEGYVYVDKTAYIYRLIASGQYYFLSRPRRFGKSLLLSTIHAYFAGERDLFRGLALDTLTEDWTPRPVLHFDLNAENYMDRDGLTNILDSILSQYESEYGVLQKSPSLASRFRSLILAAHNKTGRKVTILVDEYDKPLLGIEDDRELFDNNQAILKGFLGMLKTMDPYIGFALITGVARFNKVSIFSDLNNLNDISLDDRYGGICGWAEEELTTGFASGIRALGEALGLSYEDSLKELRRFYDGYLFTRKGPKIYNPFSVLKALDSCSLDSYWFQTGTPTFLVNRIRKNNMLLPSLDSQWCTEGQLREVGLDSRNPVSLLFQTGYLTIKSYDSERKRYELHFPNHEVETGFAHELLPAYLPRVADNNDRFSIFIFQDFILDGKPELFMERIQDLLKDIPYEQHNEKLYQNTVYLLFTLLGAITRVERHTSKGRTDLEVETSRYIYIFEFKYNGSAREALQQIHERDYAGRHRPDSRAVYLIGANFSSRARGLEDWIIEGPPGGERPAVASRLGGGKSAF